VTPYAAAQVQNFRTPLYSETAVSGSPQFALTYDANTVTAVRAELGYWIDHLIPTGHGNAIALRARAAWANDSGSDQRASAAFQMLPGAGFTVQGAKSPSNLALLTAGAELRLRGGFSLGAKFDSEVSTRSNTYSVTGTARYAW
jgi:uncharacterized protein with beta-barrel porin domain